MGPKKAQKKAPEGQQGDEERNDTDRFRDWAATGWPEESDPRAELERLKDKEHMYRFIVAGLERCPSNGRLHIHVGIYFRDAKNRHYMKKAFPYLFNFQAVKSWDNYDPYCQKDGDFYRFGKRPYQGKRNDIAGAVNDIMVYGEDALEVMVATPHLGRMRGFLYDLEARCLAKRRRTEAPKVAWIYGPTNTGKSRFAFEGQCTEDIYVCQYKGNWWCNYTGQRRIIMDDYRGQWDFSFLLRLFDRNVCMVDRKNKPAIPVTSPEIIVTSAKSPEEVYAHEEEDMEQLRRRIKVFKFKGDAFDDAQVRSELLAYFNAN